MDNPDEIVICLGSSCFSRGNKSIVEIIKNYLKEKGLTEKVFFRGDLCTNNCENGPIIKIGGKVHIKVTPDKVKSILSTYFDTYPEE